MSKKIAITSVITYLTTIIMFVFDQWTKSHIVNNLALHQSWDIYPWLKFTHVYNIGAAFSILEGKVILLSLFAGIVSLGIIVYEIMSKNERTKTLSYSIGFILGGALGNFVDRVRLKHVIDFLDLRATGPINIDLPFFEFTRNAGQNIWPIFNVADISINIGIALLIVFFIFQDNEETRDKVRAKNNNLKTSEEKG